MQAIWSRCSISGFWFFLDWVVYPFFSWVVKPWYNYTISPILGPILSPFAMLFGFDSDYEQEQAVPEGESDVPSEATDFVSDQPSDDLVTEESATQNVEL